MSSPLLNFSTHKKNPCRNVEFWCHLQKYRGDKINSIWKHRTSILGCSSSWWDFLTHKKISCENVEWTGDKYYCWRYDTINWMWKYEKSALGCPTFCWKFFIVLEILYVDLGKLPSGHPHRYKGDMMICIWRGGKINSRMSLLLE